MQYNISCLYRGAQWCDQIIEAPNDGAAVIHYESLLARQLSSTDFQDYTLWRLERLPVEAKLIVEGETETEKKDREIREKLATKKNPLVERCPNCGALLLTHGGLHARCLNCNS